jgi:hypothetical protein
MNYVTTLMTSHTTEGERDNHKSRAVGIGVDGDVGTGVDGPPTGTVSVQPCTPDGDGQMFDVAPMSLGAGLSLELGGKAPSARSVSLVSAPTTTVTVKTSGANDMCIDNSI